MNDDRRKFWRQAQNPLLCAAGALALGGCAGLAASDPFADVAVAPGSPAAAVTREAATPGPYPVLAEIPAAPDDVRGAQEWREAVADLSGARERLLANTAPGTFELTGTDAFAERIVATADVRPGDVPTEAEIAESEAFARRLRERATPPPRPR